jgi:hypothetical protein
VHNPYSLFLRVYESEEPPPTEKYTKLGGKLRSLLLACWTREPTQRPSATELMSHPFMQQH